MPVSFDRIPLSRRLNLISCGIDLMLGRDRALALPPIVRVEPTNHCNLECPLCPAGIDAMGRPKGFLAPATMRRLLDDLDGALLLAILYGWGEPFLNRDLPRVIEMCTLRGVSTLATTNGHRLQNLDQALRVVDAGLGVLIIALDGSTQEIYGRYRKRGDVEKVKRCIGMVEEAKARRRSAAPYTNIRVVVTGDNHDDLPNIERLARGLGVDMFSTKTIGMLPHEQAYRGYEPRVREQRRFEYTRAEERVARDPLRCPFPFRQPTVFWAGTVVGCEYDYRLETPWGVVGERPFEQIWNSPPAEELRRSIREGRGRPRWCQLCPYQDRVQDSCALTWKQLRDRPAPG